jgi:hypothetical protein
MNALLPPNRYPEFDPVIPFPGSENAAAPYPLQEAPRGAAADFSSAALVALTTAGPADNSASPGALSAGAYSSSDGRTDEAKAREVVPVVEVVTPLRGRDCTTVGTDQTGVGSERSSLSDPSAASIPCQGALAADRAELFALIGTGATPPYPAGPWPDDFDPIAILRAIPDVWSDPAPLILRQRPFVDPARIPAAWPELEREQH